MTIYCLLGTITVYAQQKAINPFQIIKPVKEAFQPLLFNEIKPTGWLQKELQKNLSGFTGHLDSLVPDLILKDDIYGVHRLSKNVKSKNVGALSDEGEWQVQFLWWNSETQSNWLDGYIRTAILLNDQQALQKAERLIKQILATQDKDGYIGIYDQEMRYHFNNENGELWSKTTLYRALLGWYEFKKDQQVLAAIEKAVNNLLQVYPINQSHPFYSVNPNAGGLTHGLAFTDVLERLYTITRKKKYLDYCLFLYQDFSAQTLNEDAQFAKLMNTQTPLKGHGVHTYEHLRSVTAAYYASGNPELKKALDHFLVKIASTITPSGGPVGDEFILGKTANASIGYEFCSLHELMAGWINLMNKSGKINYADQAEHLFFNAAMGNTHPTESGICYLKQDNAYFLTGGNNGDTLDKNQTRYRYSPIHKEAAVCCIPNAGRMIPYYIQNMWVKDHDGLVASLLGPCEVNTTFQKNIISINEETDYPFENTIRLTITNQVPGLFSIKIRKPQWAVQLNASLPYTEENGFLVFRRVWGKKTLVNISFTSTIVKKETSNQEVYFENGPLVLCHPIEATETITKKFPIAQLHESVYTPTQLNIYQYNKQFQLPIADQAHRYTMTLINSATGKKETIYLVPMAKTILRQVTFKIKD